MHSAIIALMFLSGSALLFFLGATAILRLPDVYTRLNILTKAVALGMAGLAGALLAQGPGLIQGGKIVSVWMLVYFAGLLARRWVVRTAESRKIAPWEV